jgi:hypothetical protein
LLRGLCDKKILGFSDLHRADCRFHFCWEQEQIPQWPATSVVGRRESGLRDR